MKPWIRLVLVLGLLAPAGGCGRDDRPTITIYAAASLTDVVETAARDFEAGTGIRVAVRTGSSGSLALAIQRGAPADVFLSASVHWMDELDRRGLTRPQSRVDFAGNRLAVVVPKGSDPRWTKPEDLSRVARLAVGETTTVPAGVYAREALEHLGLWDVVAPRSVESADVRAALALVERGEVDAGVVYLTDALRSDKVRVAFLLPAESHSPIRYPAAVLAAATQPRRGQRFLDYLLAPPGRRILRDRGFEPGTSP